MCYLKRTFILFTIFIVGCAPASKVDTVNPIAEKSKDVFILSNLIHDHLKRTNGRTLDLAELLRNDTLSRIQNSFDTVKLIPRGGYIAVYYTFSKSRDNTKIELTGAESERMHRMKWTEKKAPGEFDGEIQFQYGERFYHIKKYRVEKK